MAIFAQHLSPTQRTTIRLLRARCKEKEKRDREAEVVRILRRGLR